MRLFSYVVLRDYGFAPNPFHGTCTLATCKPDIRRVAAMGDWVLGTGPRSLGRDGRLVFAMRVTDKISFDEYWADPQFAAKRPYLRGSLKRAYGDNIYHADPETGEWLQESSHHSFHDGLPNPENVEQDTRSPLVLVSTDYMYWGRDGPIVPAEFRQPPDRELQAARGHRSRYADGFEQEVVAWLRSLDVTGVVGMPLEWRKHGPDFE